MKLQNKTVNLTQENRQKINSPVNSPITPDMCSSTAVEVGVASNGFSQCFTSALISHECLTHPPLCEEETCRSLIAKSSDHTNMQGAEFKELLYFYLFIDKEVK